MSVLFHLNAARAGGAALFAAMVFVGWQLGGEAPAASDSTAAEARPARASMRPTRTERRYGAPDRVKRQLHAIRGGGEPQERMRATIALVNSLPVEELGRWLDQRWFEYREGYELTLFNKLAKERWQREDPEGYLKWTIEEGSDDVRFIEGWADDDPARALAFFKENPGSEGEFQALLWIAQNDPATAFAHLREMLSNDPAASRHEHHIRQLFGQLARDAPSLLESELASLPARSRLQAETALAGERLKVSFDEEIRKLWERPDGWEIFSANLNSDRSLAAGILDDLEAYPASWKAQIATRLYLFVDGSNAAKWLAADLEASGFTGDQARNLRSYAIQHLARIAPEDGLQALDGSGLSRDERQSLIQSIFTNVARNADKADALMALLGSEEDRQAAREAIDAQNQHQGSSPVSPAKVETPAEWLEQVGNIDPRSGNAYPFLSLLSGWDEERIAELGRGFQSLPDDSKRQIATLLASNVFGHDAHPALRGDAIHYLVGNSVDDGRQAIQESSRLASMHVVRWASADPVAASQWADHLPEGEAKLWARKNLASQWSQYDPDAAAQWIGSLPAEAREEVNRFVKDGGAGR